MAEITHGIDTKKQTTSVSSPVEVACGIPFVVGTSPAHMVGGKVNSVIMANSYEEAVTALGYSDSLPASQPGQTFFPQAGISPEPLQAPS